MEEDEKMKSGVPKEKAGMDISLCRKFPPFPNICIALNSRAEDSRYPSVPCSPWLPQAYVISILFVWKLPAPSIDLARKAWWC